MSTLMEGKREQTLISLQVINGGKGSNRTVDRIILESPLVQVYRNLHTVFQRNFMHTQLTTQHAEVNMEKTFLEVCKHLSKHSPHEVQNGRKSKYNIPDLTSRGAGMMDKSGAADTTEDGGEGIDERAAFEDIVVELGI